MLKTPTNEAPENQPELQNQKLKTEKPKKKKMDINFCYQFLRVLTTLNLQKFSD